MDELTKVTAELETRPRFEPGMGLPPKIPDSWSAIFELLLNQRGIENIHQPGQFDHTIGLLKARIQSRLESIENLKKQNSFDLAKIEAVYRFQALHKLPDRFLKKDFPREWSNWTGFADSSGKPMDRQSPPSES